MEGAGERLGGITSNKDHESKGKVGEVCEMWKGEGERLEGEKKSNKRG